LATILSSTGIIIRVLLYPVIDKAAKPVTEVPGFIVITGFGSAVPAKVTDLLQ